MKELRVQHRGKPLRAFFAFDPLRQTIVLCIGDKGGKKRFYKEMLEIAITAFNTMLKLENSTD